MRPQLIRACERTSELALLSLVLCTVLVGCESKEPDGFDAATGPVIATPDAAPPPPPAQPTMPVADASAPAALSDASAPRPDATTPVMDAAPPVVADAGDATVPDAGPASPDAGDAAIVGDASSGATMPGTVPIPAPVADGCVSRVTAGDHTFTCGGIEFKVMVDDRCTKFACGLIFEVHGAFMTADDMRRNGRLHQLAPPKGFITVHPTAPGSTWDWTAHPKELVSFMTSMIKAFHVDTKRVHFTGFSMGSGMTFWFLCNHREVLASVAPVTGSSASQVTTPDGRPCIESIGAGWTPRVPILFMSGAKDTALTIDAARMRTEGLVSRLMLTGGMQIAGDMSYTRKHWEAPDGMVLEFLEHQYENTILAGHCIPGGVAGDLFACDGRGSLDWGPTVLQWFIDHPKR